MGNFRATNMQVLIKWSACVGAASPSSEQENKGKVMPELSEYGLHEESMEKRRQDDHDQREGGSHPGWNPLVIQKPQQVKAPQTLLENINPQNALRNMYFSHSWV